MPKARYEHIPTYAYTEGADVADLCSLAGLTPDDSQQRILDAIFAQTGDDTSAAFEIGIIAPRQNLKTAVSVMAALGWLYLTDAQLIIWSAHEFKTAVNSFRQMAQIVENVPELSRDLHRVYLASGSEAIELKPKDGEKYGKRIQFYARTKSGGRGLTANKIILDEAFNLRSEHMGSLLPTLATVKDPQIIYGSSAGMEDSDVLRGVRDRGRQGSDPRLAYFEWCSDPGGCKQDECEHLVGTTGCALDDRKKWAEANPAYGIRITEQALSSFRQSLAPNEFAREFLGWWDEPEVEVDEWAQIWQELETDDAPDGRLTLAVDVSPNRVWSTVAVCGENNVLEIIERKRGANWLAEYVQGVMQRQGIDKVTVDPGGPFGSLMREFENRQIPMRIMDGRDLIRAADTFAAGINEKVIRHRGEPELSAALAGAKKKEIGEGWKWSRRDSTVDITPLVAATWAYYSAQQGDDAEISPEIYFL